MPTMERVREVRERLAAAGTVVAREDGVSRELFPVAIGVEEGLALRDWVHREGALRTLETGLGYAFSTLFILEGLLANGVGGRHVAADPYQLSGLPMHKTTYVGVGLQTLEEAGVRDLVEFYEEESQILLPRLLAEGRSSTSSSSMATTASKGCSSTSSTRVGSSKWAASSLSMTRSSPAYDARSISASRTWAGFARMVGGKAITNGWWSGRVRATCS